MLRCRMVRGKNMLDAIVGVAFDTDALCLHQRRCPRANARHQMIASTKLDSTWTVSAYSFFLLRGISPCSSSFADAIDKGNFRHLSQTPTVYSTQRSAREIFHQLMSRIRPIEHPRRRTLSASRARSYAVRDVDDRSYGASYEAPNPPTQR